MVEIDEKLLAEVLLIAKLGINARAPAYCGVFGSRENDELRDKLSREVSTVRQARRLLPREQEPKLDPEVRHRTKKPAYIMDGC